MNLFAGLEEILTENHPLAPYTWLKIGGPAQYFLAPKTPDQLHQAVTRCMENNVQWRILGHGANLLIDDKGIIGAVIKLDETTFGQVEFTDNHIVKAGAAASLASVVLESVRRGYSGIEVLVGIPGSVGGAVTMNAGGRYGDIGAIVTQLDVVDHTAAAYTRVKPELAFTYRHSNINDQIVTSVQMQLTPDEPQRVLNKMRELWIVKKSSQPLSSRSAGCIFKNPTAHQAAGALIDRAGLKGASVGGAKVSQKHANFIVTEPGTTYKDVATLIEIVRTKIRDTASVELELEVEIWRH